MILAGSLCLGLPGCGGDEERDVAQSTVAIAEGTVIPEGVGAPMDTVTPYAGLWDVRMVQGHLARQGVETTQLGEVRNSLLSPPGTRLKAESGEVQVFIYADAGARGLDADSAKLAELQTLPGFQQASLVTADNVAILVIGEDSALRESVRDVVQKRRR